MKYLIICALVLVGACTKEEKPNPIKQIGCTIGVSVGMGISTEIATALECKNPAAIQASIYDALVKMQVCDAQKASASVLAGTGTGNYICKVVGGTLVSTILAGAIPAPWECSAVDVQAKLSAAIQKACAKIP